MQYIGIVIAVLILINWIYVIVVYFKNKKSILELVLGITATLTFILFFIGSISLVGEMPV